MSLEELRQMLEPALILCGPAALILALYFGLRFFMVAKRIRKESQKSFEIASNIEEAYQRFHDEVNESRQRLREQFDEMERDIALMMRVCLFGSLRVRIPVSQQWRRLLT